MSDMTAKPTDQQLRRNIWRSLLIMRSATLHELPTVVRGLSYRKARSLMRELETHGYVMRSSRRGRPEYSQAIDSPSLPDVCAHCDRPFAVKACTPKERKRGTERETQREAEGQKPRKKKRNRTTAAMVVTRIILDLASAGDRSEVSHDAA